MLQCIFNFVNMLQMRKYISWRYGTCVTIDPNFTMYGPGSIYGIMIGMDSKIVSLISEAIFYYFRGGVNPNWPGVKLLL